jgi:hypothetical protein
MAFAKRFGGLGGLETGVQRVQLFDLALHMGDLTRLLGAEIDARGGRRGRRCSRGDCGGARWRCRGDGCGCLGLREGKAAA